MSHSGVSCCYTLLVSSNRFIYSYFVIISFLLHVFFFLNFWMGINIYSLFASVTGISTNINIRTYTISQHHVIHSVKLHGFLDLVCVHEMP